MLIEIHMLKNYPVTNLNRDETGLPKTCMFGGVQRGRISSQCLKYSWRYSWRTSASFKKKFGEDMIATRTRTLPEEVAKSLKKQDIPEEYIEVIMNIVAEFGKKDEDEKTNKDKENSKKLKTETKQIISYSSEDFKAITDCITEELKKCKNIDDVKKIDAKKLQKNIGKRKNRAITLDMALFGRMVTSDAFDDVEASMQVAHAISTHRVYMESDFFSAVDDLKPKGGSAILGDIDYNSSCYYIYASIDTDKLRDNLKNFDNADEVMKTAIPALIRTMFWTNPSGKKNSLPGPSMPSAILVECKEKHIPVSYANAYEIPVKPFKDSGIVTESIERLRDECMKSSKYYGIPVEKRLWFTTKPEIVFENDFAMNCSDVMELIEQLPQM